MSRTFLAMSLCLALLIASMNAGAAPKYSDWCTPTNLGSVVNLAGDESGPAISKDGLSLYFESTRAGGSGLFDIWVSERDSVNDGWHTPLNLGSTVNTNVVDRGPALSRDGHWLFFNSNRNGGYGGVDLWVSYREDVHDNFAWETPVNLGSGVNSAAVDQGPSYFENDDDGVPLLYFSSSRSGGVGGSDIYVSALQSDGSWGDAELVSELSSTASEFRPMVRHDGLEIFLFSDRAGGQGGYDMWVSTRADVSDNWSTPVNLGETINTASSDYQGYLSSDGKTLYFASNRTGGEGSFDLYSTTRTKG